MDAIQTGLQAIYDLPLSVLIRENGVLFPAVESLHVLSIVTVFGMILIVDLRLLGLASLRLNARRMNSALVPVAIIAFGLAILTGGLMFMSNAVAYAANLQFLLKMGVIVLAGINMMVLHAITEKQFAGWEIQTPPPFPVRLAGAISLLLWVAVIFLGRWIGFTLQVGPPM